MKTLRESSKRLSTKYKFKRRLQSIPEVTKAFSYRDERINRIKAVKDICILEPLLPNLIDIDTQDSCVEYTPPIIHIRRDETNWPFRIEYIEQILDVKELWIVVTDERNKAITNRNLMSTIEQTSYHGISLDLMKIECPRVVVGFSTPFGTSRRKTLVTEKELRACEDEYWNQGSMLNTGYEPVRLEGKYPEQSINLYLCNILPTNLTLYNATFYNRDVAHLYLDSLSESIKRFIDHQSIPYH